MQIILLKTLVKTSMLKVFMSYRNLCLYFLRWMMLRDLFIAVMEIILEEIVRDRNTSTKRIYSSSRKKLIIFFDQQYLDEKEKFKIS